MNFHGDIQADHRKRKENRNVLRKTTVSLKMFLDFFNIQMDQN